MAWTVAGILALAMAGYSIWSVAGAARPTAAAATSAEALQQEILRQNIGQPGDPILNQLYSDIGARYFSGKLPAMEVRWEPRLADVGKLAAQAYTLQGMFGHIGGRSIILLNPGLQGDRPALTRALCHEIVHAFLFSTGITTGEHGPVFQSALKRLADEGGFEGVVASDEERVNLRAWLDAESARLDFERAEIDRLSVEIEHERVEIERALSEFNARVSAANAQGSGWPSESEVAAANARRDAYNWRATDANERVQRDRADLEHFNREVERYNLMLVYPDGLDARALVKPKTRTSR
jgi:SprT-like family